jgi:hypothetical protein
MAILLDRDKLGNAHPTFLPLLWNLQKTLRQAAIAILEIGSASSQIHIFDLQQLPSVSYKKTELRLYQMLLHNAPETPLTETIISSIQSGRCFACHTPPQPTACVVPYGFPANPLIYRPQSYHNHLADPKNSQKGIGATWLPGDVLAVAEGRWLWDIAFPYDNSNEKQNEIIAATSAPSQQPVLASTTNVARLEFNHPKDHARMPPFCNPPPVDPNKWDAFLNRL